MDLELEELRRYSEPNTVYRCICGHIIEVWWKGELWHKFDNGEDAIMSKNCRYCDCKKPIIKE